MKIRQWYLIPVIAFLFFAFAHVPARASNAVTTGVKIVVAPNAPSDFTAIPDAETQVTLSWTDNSNNVEDGFSVERKTGVAGTYAEIGTTGTGIATYVDNTASAATTYFYRVRAFTGPIYSVYSNEASVTTPSPATPPSGGGSSGGGGGGGGGGYYAPPVSTNNNVTVTGFAYPLSTVTILQNGVQVLQTIAGPNGIFFGSVSDFPAGTYNFYLYATDADGRKSAPFTFPVTITAGATTNISNVFFAPTIALDKQEVKQGDPLVIYGQSLPNAPITIEVDSAVPVIANTTSTASGTYVYDLNTRQLEMGSHIAKANAATGGLMSSYSTVQGFTVGTQNVAAPALAQCPARGDFNGDCKVDLVDFSMLAYWYGQQTAPAVFRLDNALTVDLRDFSILAYYWTG